MSLEHTPLASVSIEDIFAAVPTKLTDAEYTTLILELRRRRSVHLAEEAAKAAKGKSAKAPKPTAATAPEAAKADVPTSELTLDDLFS